MWFTSQSGKVKERASDTYTPMQEKRKKTVTAARSHAKLWMWISHVGLNMTYAHQPMHLGRQLTYRQRLQTESHQNKHWTTRLTLAPGNPISHHDMRHD